MFSLYGSVSSVITCFKLNLYPNQLVGHVLPIVSSCLLSLVL